MKDNNFSVMKKPITWNSTQTRVTKIVKNHGLVRRQPSAYRTKPGSEHYIDWFNWTITEWSEYCAPLDAVRTQRAVHQKEQYTENSH